MLSMTLPLLDGVNLGRHPMVAKLLKGCYNENPPRPRYLSTWDPNTVLNYMADRGENEGLPFEDISMRLATS